MSTTIWDRHLLYVPLKGKLGPRPIGTHVIASVMSDILLVVKPRGQQMPGINP
jgi:hypothetical protein